MKRIALWIAVAVVPLLMGTASFSLYYANRTTHAASPTDCCLDPNCPPGCSDQCPPDCQVTITAKTCCPEGECCPDCVPTAEASTRVVKKDCPVCPLCP